MKAHLDIRDLIIRGLVISVTSLVLLFMTRDQTFDLHFKIRKTQKISTQLIIVEVPNKTPLSRVIDKLAQTSARNILVNHSRIDEISSKVVTYSFKEAVQGALNIDVSSGKDGLTRSSEILSIPLNLPLEIKAHKPFTINFRGAANSFVTENYYDIIQSPGTLARKTIILKSDTSEKMFTTPVGLLSETELLANILDNIYENRFIPEKNLLIASLLLLCILVFTCALLLYLPSTLALISTIGFALTYISVSLWVFDEFYFWTPIWVPVVQMFITMILISNYKYVLNEKTKWNLEKESQYLNEVEEMKTNFLSLFSHDLKTPLAKIIGIADTLQSKIEDPSMSSEIKKIHNSSKDLEKYIKRILKMSQMQSKNISLNKSPVDINSLIEKSITQNRILAQEKNIVVKKQLAPLFMIDIDGPLIQEVIINFLENAITYSPEKSTILVSSEEVNDYIKVTVVDEGKGIPKEVQQHIWEKYYRFNKDKAGYGLGLFLSRYVVNLHRGEVFLNSRENKGSEFGFILPIKEQD